MSPILMWTISISMCSLAFLVWGLLMFFAQRTQMGPVTRRRFGIASSAYLFGWLLLALVLGNAGVFQASSLTTFPAIALGIALPLVIGIFILRHSLTLNRIIEAIPLSWLVGVQFYRTFGFIFLALYAIGKLPAEFALPAGIGDVAVGLAAPVVGYLFYKGYHRSCLVVLGWNIVGILDLVVALSLGFLSSPGPFQALAVDTPNEMITAFPLVLVPVFAVPLSILLHLATLKRLKAIMGVTSNNTFQLRCCTVRITAT